MADCNDVNEQLETLRRQLFDSRIEADRRVDVVKKQLTDAKAKAKALLQRNMIDSSSKIEAAEEQNKLQADELTQLKNMLREMHREKNVRIADMDSLASQLEDVKEQLSVVSNERAALEREIAEARSDLGGGKLQAAAGREGLEGEVEIVGGKPHFGGKKHAETIAETNDLERKPSQQEASDSTQLEKLMKELERSEVEIAELQATCGALRAENSDLKEVIESDTKSVSTLADTPNRTGALWEEVQQANERAESLQSCLDRTREDLRRVTEHHGKVIEDKANEFSELEKKLIEADASIIQLRSDLEKREIDLQEERKNLARAQRTASEYIPDGDEGKKILEAKVAEMERLVASKQIEINRVREKARTFLRDMNAEKRDKEERMKKDVEALKKELAEERDRVKVAEQRVESDASELDNCLALIREKQKSLQVLQMKIVTQKSEAEKANREIETLRADFARYKERARIALQEKENDTEASEAAIDTATGAIRAELGKAKVDMAEMKKELHGVRVINKKYREALERAERAEAAVDLLKKDSMPGTPPTNFTKIDMLEEKVALMERELTSSRSSVEDAEERHKTAKMRLEASERALRGAELRADEIDRVSKKTIEAFRKQVATLEGEMVRAQEAAASAQRTATAAAKALAFVSTPDQEAQSPLKRNARASPRRQPSFEDSSFPLGSMNEGRASLAAALEGHASKFGFNSPRIHSENSMSNGVSDMELSAKDQQIAVLTTQLAELGAVLDDTQGEAELRYEQNALLKDEVKNLDAKLEAAQKLQNGAPFSYLRTIVVRYLETDDPTLLPVIANVLSFTDEESSRVRDARGKAGDASLSVSSPKAGYFSIPFLGSR